MNTKGLRGVVRLAAVTGVFAAGYLCGSLYQPTAEAQFGELGKEVGKAAVGKAAGSGGALGSVMELGSTIVELQQHVDGLQKNIDVLKKVKSSLGG